MHRGFAPRYCKVDIDSKFVPQCSGGNLENHHLAFDTMSAESSKRARLPVREVKKLEFFGFSFFVVAVLNLQEN